MIMLHIATKKTHSLTRPHNNSNNHKNTFSFMSNKESSKSYAIMKTNPMLSKQMTIIKIKVCFHLIFKYTNITF